MDVAANFFYTCAYYSHCYYSQFLKSGFSAGVANMGVALQNLMEGLKSIHEGSMGGAGRGLKNLLRNTCDGVDWIGKWPSISLQVCKFTKYELLHTHFSRILARF